MDLQALKLRMENVGKKGSNALGLRSVDAFMKSSGGTIKKSKIELGKMIKRLMDLSLNFPFDPTNPESEEWGEGELFIFPDAPSSGVAWLKLLMADNPELHKFYASLGRLKPEEYDITKPEELTDQDVSVFARFRDVYHYNARVQAFKMSQFGQWKRKYLSRVKVNEHGDVIEADTGYQIYLLENAFVSSQIEAIKKSYEEGGENFGKKKDTMDAEIKLVKEGRRASNPYLLGVGRGMEFILNAKEQLSEDDTLALEKEGDTDALFGYARWWGATSEVVEEMRKIIRNTDDSCKSCFDFVEYSISYPACESKPEKERMLAAYAGKTVDKSVKSKAADRVKHFNATYLEYRNNVDKYFSDQAILKSVYAFKSVDDDYLLAAYKNDFSERLELMSDTILKNNMDLISRIDDSLCSNLIEKSMSDKLAKGSTLSLEDMEKSAGLVNQNDEGFGENEVDELDHLLNPTGEDDFDLNGGADATAEFEKKDETK